MPLSVQVNELTFEVASAADIMTLTGEVTKNPPSPLGAGTVTVTTGGVVSTVKLQLSGVASRLPAVSLERTLKVCSPSVSELRFCGLVQAANGAASSLHSNVGPPEEGAGSEPMKLKLAEA